MVPECQLEAARENNIHFPKTQAPKSKIKAENEWILAHLNMQFWKALPYSTILSALLKTFRLHSWN